MIEIKSLQVSEALYNWLVERSSGYGLPEEEAVAIEIVGTLDAVRRGAENPVAAAAQHRASGVKLAIKMFLNLYVVPDEKAFISKDELYERFQDFCRRSQQGINISKRSFYKYLYPILEEEKIPYTDYYPSIDGKRVTCLRGFQVTRL